MKTKAMAAATAGGPVDGLSKKEAAAFLGCSVRHIERRASEGLIEKFVLPKAASERAAPVVYARRDLEALKRGEIPAKDASVVADPKRPIVVNQAGALDLLLRHLSAAPALPPWLSIPKASTFSGLSCGFLRARAPELAAIGAAVDVGRGNRPRWRLLRSQLEKGFPV